MFLENIKGFHLIEIMIVIAIIGILASICFPIYTQPTIKARRLEAETMLVKLAIALEEFHLEHQTYEGAVLSDLNFSEFIAANNYRLAIQTATDHDYVLHAQPLGKQAEKDKECGTLILDAHNQKNVTGSGKVTECW